MTIQNPQIIPPRVDLIDPRTGKIAREWYLYLVNIIDLVNPENGTISDALTQLAFTADNTSEVADLQYQIDHLDLGGDPLAMTNGEVAEVGRRLSGVQTDTAFAVSQPAQQPAPLEISFIPSSPEPVPSVMDGAFVPSSPKPFPVWWQQRDVIYSGELMTIDSGHQIVFSTNLTNNGSINNSGTLAVI